MADIALNEIIYVMVPYFFKHTYFLKIMISISALYISHLTLDPFIVSAKYQFSTKAPLYSK